MKSEKAKANTAKRKTPPKDTTPHPEKPGQDVQGRFMPGNRIWEARSSYGRKPKFSDPDVLWQACCEYFKWVEENPLYEQKVFHYSGEITKTDCYKIRAMTISGLCLFLDISDDTWACYRKDTVLTGIVSDAEKIIYNQKFAGAAADLLNANIIARELGLADKQELTGKEGPIETKSNMTLDEATRVYLDHLKG